jgi:hemerythrin-like domain-containing protein
MPVQIGSVTHSFEDPTGLLSDCHRRVEMFMGALERAAQVCDREISNDNRRSLDLALRYFRDAAPKHTADEEESLFPRLRRLSDDRLATALTRLEELETDHRWAEPLHACAEQLGTRCLEQGKLSADDAHTFRDSVQRLHEMYRRHIEVEDCQIFPLAQKLLSPEAKTQIAAEMQARRGLKPVQLK